MKSQYTPVRANWGTLCVFFGCIVITSLFSTGVHGKNDTIYSMIATTAVLISISQCMYAGVTSLQYTYANLLESYHRFALHQKPSHCVALSCHNVPDMISHTA